MSNVIFDPERWESVEAGDEALIERWLVDLETDAVVLRWAGFGVK